MQTAATVTTTSTIADMAGTDTPQDIIVVVLPNGCEVSIIIQEHAHGTSAGIALYSADGKTNIGAMAYSDGSVEITKG